GRITYAEAIKGSYQPAVVGQQFGPFWSTHWFRLEIEIPTAWAGQEVHLLWDSSSEAEIWMDGKPRQGLTGSGGAFRPGIKWGPVRPEYVLTQKARGGESFLLYIEMAANNLFGLGYNEPERLEQVGLLRQAEISIFDREAWDLLWDYKVIADMAVELPPSTPRGGQALFTANQMVNQIVLEDRSTWMAARKIAADFFAACNGDGQLNLSAVGHAHIDTAWLWPLAETRRKCARSFSSAVLLMDEFPDFRFACSQAQQYEWMKEDYPVLYERIKEKVKSGQFIPAGGAWVEPDCNLPSGEALVRQFLYGQRFFRQEFGITCQEFWEPDVFGYSAALPQIMRQVGIQYFLTIKLSWNQFNKLSSQTFWWEGLDGSRVLTHFPPANIYEGNGTVKDVLYSMTNYKDLDRSNEAYYLFGFGDGGGGPTRPMLEQLKRMQDVDGLPRVQMRSPNDFFTRLEKNSHDLLTWVGELYFELHRGTYTTQANNKKYNRQCEFMLHDVELLSALAHTGQTLEYPKAEIDRLWKLVLTNQFHDIIPGSSINLVYQDSNEHYQDVVGTTAALRNQAAVSLLGKPDPIGRQVCALNTIGFPRTELIELPEGAIAAQTSADGKPLGIVSAPPYGFSIFTPSPGISQQVAVVESGDSILLENEFVRAELRRDGALASLFDKRAGRESIQPDRPANRFILFDDQPNNWDAWDVDVFHLEKQASIPGAKSSRVIEPGPLRVSVAYEYDLSPRSTLVQIVSLSAVSPRLDFSTEVEWHERHKFLKVEFPLNVRAMNATYETQFGHLQRPTHFNTSWDMARFEVVAHKWADLSDPQFGVALLNDCKYGHATHGSIMRLSLLRSPTAPDPEADQGYHIFRYALLPHPGSPQMAGVIEEGYRFNVPLHIFPTSAEPTQRSYFSVSNPGIVLDTVKKAEDSDDIVLRLYEAHGAHGTARLLTSLPVESIRPCNLLEDDQPGESVPWPAGGFPFTAKPFEIQTYKLKLKEH
ncbi:MAG: alpha-mannosidase, partial [Chloroflexi bacterium]